MGDVSIRSPFIIRPDRPRLLPDPYIAPIHGTHGPCALCRNYSHLTENHVPPAAVGNVDRWVAQSYMVESTANKDMYFGRSFRGGVRFRTLCAACNNGLGGNEDKEIIAFFERVTKSVESRIIQPQIVRIPARPTYLLRDFSPTSFLQTTTAGPTASMTKLAISFSDVRAFG